MTIANSAEYRIARLVDQLFSTGRYGEPFINPVTGFGFMYGDDPIEPQKEAARRALGLIFSLVKEGNVHGCAQLLAREWFAINGPADAQPLPISDYDIEDRKYGWGSGLPAINKAFHFVVSHYAASLQANDWDIKLHPSFDDYFRGVLALKNLPTTNLPRIGGFDFDGLCKRYPPRPLPGLDRHLNWEPPARARRAA